MADISQYLQAIMSAVYGEDVRGSIHDAIALINDVGEAVLTLGTAVDSPTSPTTGFYQDSVYLNTATGDMWTCTGTGWSLSGNTRGAQGDPGLAATIDVGTVTGGAVASVTNSGTTSAAVFDFVLPKGDKGDTGDGLTAESERSGSNTIVSIKNTTTQTVVDTFNVPDGVPGATGNGIASIAKTATAGLVDTYTITYTDGTSTTFTVTNGQDGQGAGDMTKVAYDPTNSVADAGGIPAYVSAHGGTTYTGEKGVVVAGTTIKAALVNDSASSLASAAISVSANRQYAVNLDSNDKLSVNVPWVNTTYSDATTLASGLMSASDKTKLNGLDEVVANPAGSPTDDLSSIQIGSTVYRLQGGGGTTIVQIPSVSGTSFTYDGTAQGAAITGLDTTHCTIVPGTGTTVTTVGDTTYVKATNAGSYSFSVELNDTSSMVWSDLTIADKTYSFTIAKATQTITASKNSVSLTAQQPSDTVTISGQQGSLNVSSSDTGVATVSESSGVVTITGVDNGSATVSVYAAETANYAQSATISISVAVSLKAPLVAFETATDAQITAILNSFYNDEYTAAEITSLKTTYWPIGAKRSVPISAMAATGVSEAHHADTYEYVIIGHEHDTLATPINGHTKALLTLQQDRIFYKNTTDGTYTSNYPSAEDEGGYMNSQGSSVGGWNNCTRRTWCNQVYFAALPQYIQTAIKEVNKLTANGGLTSATIVTSVDKAFLLSEVEIFGTISQSKTGEGTQYAYFSNAATNKYRLPASLNGGSGVTALYWERSPHIWNAEDGFCDMLNDGTASYGTSNFTLGICPAFCL